MTAALLVLAACGLLAPAKPAPPRVFEGTLLSAAAGRPLRVTLTAADGRAHTVTNAGAARMLFQDPALHGRTVRLLAVAAGTTLTVKKVQTVKAGKAFDVDYWCESCQMSYDAPGACKCCGGETVLRERPAD